MAEPLPFAELMKRVRAGDGEAAEELVRFYEPAIRRAVRVRLVDSRMRRVLDSMDVCQSVMGSFFVRAALGQYAVTTPEQLLNLLVVIARNKLADEAKYQRAARRDFRRAEGGSIAGRLPASGPTPSQQVSSEELLDACRQRLTSDERWLAEQRAQGREWLQIARERGEDAEVLRKRLARAVERVTQELGLEA
jgi:RNA polymerase sigma-70 factor (ECF subfamily)